MRRVLVTPWDGSTLLRRTSVAFAICAVLALSASLELHAQAADANPPEVQETKPEVQEAREVTVQVESADGKVVEVKEVRVAVKAAAPANPPVAAPADPFAPAATPATVPKPPTTPPTAAKPADAAKPAEPPKPAPPPAGSVAVQTIDNERIIGVLGEIKDGRLTVQSQPPRTLALDEIERVEFGGSAGKVAVEWIGQDQHDVVQVGGAAGGNGIADMHLRLSGLSTVKKITQLVIVCRYPGQVRVWRLDTTQSPHWKIAMERSGQASFADLYMEPTNLDAFEREFAVTVTYEGGTTDKAAVKASTHTSDQQKVATAVAAAAAKPPAGPPTVAVHLDGPSTLGGKLLALEEESLTLGTAWGKELKIPLVKVVAVWFAPGGAPPTSGSATHSSDSKPAVGINTAAKNKTESQADAAAGEDAVTMLARDGKSVTIRGHVLGFADGKLHVDYDGEKRTINQARLVGVTLSAHPQPRPSASPYQVLQLTSGDRVTGQLVGSAENSLTMQTAWDAALEIPREAVSQIGFRNGKQVFLSDVDPIGVEETPYFGRHMPYRRDESLTGGPLKIKGATYAKGLAVHSRSVLEYAVDGQYEMFRALVGFDDESGGCGAVAFRVLGDDRELLKVPDLRASGEPVPVEVSIAGVKQLTLEVDFGDLEDTGDRVIWAQPRIFRAGAGQPAAK